MHTTQHTRAHTHVRDRVSVCDTHTQTTKTGSKSESLATRLSERLNATHSLELVPGEFDRLTRPSVVNPAHIERHRLLLFHCVCVCVCRARVRVCRSQNSPRR